ncbi:hypothetical protein QQF64_028201 [Cirrhinus molitorella]|uniref:Uncharacterized protein n=1 Tax=Cirrhinus molitorella TaxID=172907 RepID=A0ABR3N5Y3_9TELE
MSIVWLTRGQKGLLKTRAPVCRVVKARFPRSSQREREREREREQIRLSSGSSSSASGGSSSVNASARLRTALSRANQFLSPVTD